MCARLLARMVKADYPEWKARDVNAKARLLPRPPPTPGQAAGAAAAAPAASAAPAGAGAADAADAAADASAPCAPLWPEPSVRCCACCLLQASQVQDSLSGVKSSMATWHAPSAQVGAAAAQRWPPVLGHLGVRVACTTVHRHHVPRAGMVQRGCWSTNTPLRNSLCTPPPAPSTGGSRGSGGAPGCQAGRRALDPGRAAARRGDCGVVHQVWPGVLACAPACLLGCNAPACLLAVQQAHGLAPCPARRALHWQGSSRRRGWCAPRRAALATPPPRPCPPAAALILL